MPPPGDWIMKRGDIFMNATQVRAIFNKALSLKPKESIKITLPSKGQAVSFRTMLYRERKKLLDQGGQTDLVVSTIEETLGGVVVVTISCLDPLEMFIVSADGVKRPVDLELGFKPEDQEAAEDLKEIFAKYKEKKKNEA